MAAAARARLPKGLRGRVARNDVRQEFDRKDVFAGQVFASD